MDELDYFISKARCTLPDLCTVRDLKKLGIVKGAQAARLWRKKKIGPQYFEINGRFYYPREAILRFLKEAKCSTS
jgi:hypothetical protein